MEASGRGFGIELLTHTNYKKWKSCLESYLIGEDLWEVVGGDSQVAPAMENDQAFKAWRKMNAKAEFTLKRAITPDLFDHIIGCKAASEIWIALDGLFNKKNMARLQFLENELAKASQGDQSISAFFLRIKNLCAEISAIDPEEPISEAKMKRHIIRGLKKEYISFVTAVQGWATQPSMIELENLLASQESLAMQMAGMSVSSEGNEALFTGKKKQTGWKKKKDVGENPSTSSKESGSNSPHKDEGKKTNARCFRCKKVGHFKKDCRVNLHSGHAAEKKVSEDDCWGDECLLAEKVTTVDALASVNFNDDWIVDSGCGHHLTGDGSKFSSLRKYEGNDAIVTADNSVHPVKNEGAVVIGHDGNTLKLNSVYHVPGLKKNLFSVSNAVDAGFHVLFGPKEVKFLKNVSSIKGEVSHTGRRIRDMFVLSASSYVEKMKSNDSAAMWHERLGHIGMDKLKAMATKELVRDLPKLSSYGDGHVCEGCQYGKSHRLPFDSSLSRCKSPLECVYSDIMGPMATPSFSGKRYTLIFVDDFSRFTWTYILQEKSEAFAKFVEFKEVVEGELGRKLKKLRTDNGREFTSDEFFRYCRKHGIKRELTCAYTPQQNGIAERKNRHIAETCRCWLHAKGIPKALWAEGMLCATYVINRMPLSPNNQRTPYELLFGAVPSVKHMRVFGATCFVHVPDQQRSKLDSKATKCIFIGYDDRRKGWKCMNPQNKKIIVSRDVVFDEMTSYGGSSIVLEESNEKTCEDDNNNAVELAMSPNAPNHSSSTFESEHISRGSNNGSHCEGGAEPVLRRSKRTIVPPARYKEGNLVTMCSCYFAGPLDEREPTSYEEAACTKEWVSAMDEEMSALEKNETWDLVPKKEGIVPITCKWVYKVKKKADGQIERFKARLVARGFSQKYGEDYDETFSPVAKMTSIRVVIAFAACKGWKLWQLDVKNAFLYGEIDKDIFMEQPPGYISSKFPNHVCKLKKALYGLKQAPRAWYGKIAEYLHFCGYIASDSDPSLFVKKKGNVHVLVILYVDDMIITGNDDGEVAMLRAELSIRFDMKDLGPLHHFLGLEVHKKRDGLFICQQGYAKNIVERFGMKDGKTCSTPLEVNFKLSRDEGRLLDDPKPYRALVGSLIYLTITRPDISYAVGVISRYMQEPRKPHFEVAKRILKYVKATIEYGLFYEKGKEFTLHGFSDADYAGDIDDRRSTSGYSFMCESAAISWCSRKQECVSLSTTEAEYKALSLAAQECIWLRRLFEDIHGKIKGATLIYEDNESALKLATNPVFHARTKHIEIEHHFVREKVLEGIIILKHVRSKENIADIFTKALSKELFEYLRSMLGLIPQTHLEGEY